MKSDRHIYRMDLVRIFASPVFYLSILLVVALCCLCSWEDLQQVLSHRDSSDVTYIFSIMLGLGAFKNMILLAAALPGVGNFCSDWNHQFIRPVCVRCGVRKYSGSKIVSCAVSTFLTVFLGMLLFVLLLLALGLPLLGRSGQGVATMYGSLLSGGYPMLYFIDHSVLLSAAAVFWGTVGLYVSSWIPNHFVAIASPFISYYLLGEFGEYLPSFMNFRMLAYGYNVIGQGIGITMLYTVCFFGVLTFVAGKLFQKNVQRRVANELF